MFKSILLSSLAATAAGRNLIFDSRSCNTNWLEKSNWDVSENAGPDMPPGWVGPMDGAADATASQWADMKISFDERGADVLMETGVYALSELELPVNGELTLDNGGAQLQFENLNSNRGRRDDHGDYEFTFRNEAHFTGGYDDNKHACDFGCANNWFVSEYGKADAVADYDARGLARATEPPCSNDDVFFPQGFKVQTKIGGFKTVNSMTWVVDYDDNQALTVRSKDMIPTGAVYPAAQDLDIHFGAAAFEMCDRRGTTTGEGADATCMCVSQCPAGNSMATAIEQANSLRDAARRIAAARASEGNDNAEFEFTFSGVGDTEQSGFNIDLSQCSGTTRLSGFNAELGSQLPGGASVSGGRIAYNGKDIVVSGTLSASASVVSWSRTGDINLPIFAEDTPRPSEEWGLRFYYAVWDATLKQMVADSCIRESSVTGYRQRAGLKMQQESTIFIGETMPQMDLYRLVDKNNKDEFSSAVHAGLQGYGGMTNLDQGSIRAGLEISSLEEQALANAETNFGRSRRASYGPGEKLIRLELMYDSYGGPIRGGSPAAHEIQAQAADTAAGYPITLDSSVTCFTLEAGFDVECLKNAILEADGDDLGASCQTAVGPCGLMGTKSGKPHSSSPEDQCVDESELGTAINAGVCTEAVEAAESQQAADTQLVIIIAACAGAGALILLVLFVKYRPRGRDSDAAAKNRNVVAFENPMYDEPGGGGQGALAAAAADPGLYDEPAFNDGTAKQNPIADASDDEAADDADDDQGGYLDVEQDSESESGSEEESSDDESDDE